MYDVGVMELLLPTTDAGVGVQGALAAALLSVAFWMTRHRRDGRVFVWGIAVLSVAGFGLRALH